ncbi:MAG: peptide-methionine (S)-S-oxide reductase MsrA [Bryobacteraceae bacterium]
MKKAADFLPAALLVLGVLAMNATNSPVTQPVKTGANSAAFPDPSEDLPAPVRASSRTAVLAGGCFWCVEAVFEQVEGVLDVVAGYAGGDERTARYDLVSTGTTGHAEAVRITYDPRKISYGQLLKIFFAVAHDPTQLNRQGPDNGPQYRSAIFYASEEERRVAEAYIRQLQQARVFSRPIVTRLEPLKGFYPAEDYHQDFARRNPANPYILTQSAPKVHKLEKTFPGCVRRGKK